MKSTGEVMGIDNSFAMAFAKSQIAGGTLLPVQGKAFLSVRDHDKEAALPIARRLIESGFSLVATHGTSAYLRKAGIVVETVNKVLEGSPHIVDAIRAGEIAVVMNTVEGAQSVADSFSIRRSALNVACHILRRSRVLVPLPKGLPDSGWGCLGCDRCRSIINRANKQKAKVKRQKSKLNRKILSLIFDFCLFDLTF